MWVYINFLPYRKGVSASTKTDQKIYQLYTHTNTLPSINSTPTCNDKRG